MIICSYKNRTVQIIAADASRHTATLLMDFETPTWTHGGWSYEPARLTVSQDEISEVQVVTPGSLAEAEINDDPCAEFFTPTETDDCQPEYMTYGL